MIIFTLSHKVLGDLDTKINNQGIWDWCIQKPSRICSPSPHVYMLELAPLGKD